MSEKRAVEKTMLTQAYNGRKPGSPMGGGEAAIRASLKAQRATRRTCRIGQTPSPLPMPSNI